MKRAWIIGIAAVAAIVPAVAGAQEGAVVATAGRKIALEQAAAGGGKLIAGAVETRVTQGRPYTAESINETLQVLGDGNRINRRSVTRVYRDSEGRTRREMLNDDGSVRNIAISDPVAHTSFTLDPKTKTAYKAGGNVVMPLMREGTYTVTQRPADTPTGRGEQVRTGTVAVAGGRGGGGGGRVALTPSTVGENANIKKEELAPQNMEGVMANGTRTTTVIPAGQIGNALEIRVVSEQWFSDDLQVLVMTRHNDPRSGETTYRLRNILRAEPDPSLFTVPADYTLQERGIKQPE